MSRAIWGLATDWGPAKFGGPATIWMGLWLRPQRGRRREERGVEEREGEGPGPQQIFWPGTAPRRNWHGRMLFSIENVTQQRAISSDRPHEAVHSPSSCHS